MPFAFIMSFNENFQNIHSLKLVLIWLSNWKKRLLQEYRRKKPQNIIPTRTCRITFKYSITIKFMALLHVVLVWGCIAWRYHLKLWHGIVLYLFWQRWRFKGFDFNDWTGSGASFTSTLSHRKWGVKEAYLTANTKNQAILKKWNEKQNGIIRHSVLKSEVLFALVAVSHIFKKKIKPRNILYFVYYLILQKF